ncbi:hypothetical protein Gogos_011708 [Gossypium gossypioides]|uniref:Uncharacterized protein n=1 Tax=Gossypium gossypioides TaxID=34282 RepID=A0A7J9BQ76_GOSGO|nr:hypothetical protein [Gossypium gossypioides]
MAWLQDGKVSQLEHVFIRGSKVRYHVSPSLGQPCLIVFSRIDMRHLMVIGVVIIKTGILYLSIERWVYFDRFMVIPDMLKNAPMFKRLDAKIKGKSSSLGVGRGRAVAMRAKAQAAGRGTTGGRGVVPSVRR